MYKFFQKHKFIIFIVFIYFLNIVNAFLSTTGIFNNLLSPYKRDFFMVFNAFIGDVAFISIFVGLGFIIFKKEKSIIKYMIVITFILSFFCYAMSNYIPIYGMMFSFWNLKAFSGGGGGEAFDFVIDSFALIVSSGKLIFFFPAILILILYFTMYKRNLNIKDNSNFAFVKRIYVGIIVIMFGLIFSNVSYLNYKNVNKDNWFNDNSTPLHGTESIGLYNFYIYEGLEFVSNELNLKKNTNDNRDKILSDLKKYEDDCQLNMIDGNMYCNTVENNGLAEGKNLILMQVESLNNFAIGLKVKVNNEYLEVTPNLNRLLESSVYFNNFYTAVGIGNTSDAEFSALTGLYPSGPKYTIYEYGNVEYPTLARSFEDSGYYSFSIHANGGEFYNRKYIHENIYGFSDYYGEEELEEMGLINRDDFVHLWMGDTEFLEATVDIIKSQNELGKNVFSFPITISTHLPYSEDENLYKDIVPLFPDDYKDLHGYSLGYLKHLYYTDYAIGNMFSKMEDLGMLENTIVALYGDHGSTINFAETMKYNTEIFENDINGVFGKDFAVEGNNIVAERRFEQNVPFIIYDKTKTIEPRVISYSRGQTDIYRTLANLFGLEQQYYFGQDAFIDVDHFVYSPRTSDIFIGDMAISSSSYEFFSVSSVVKYDSLDRKRIIEEYQKYLDFNNKLLEYELFPKVSK
ncbi:MAG: sulfatase-like hydrolase/transferase [Bacilli bacterium]|nr:sulfatase-like hydrolase/transferase [Bacilli bacterium]